jgi:segregation and condensation protein A
MASGLEARPFNYLENIVEKPTWKEVLLDLIHSNSIDPWNIDIHQLADAFMKKVKELESVDFALEANVILAAAILLKYKSEYLRTINIDPNQQTALDDYMPDERVSFDEIPQLTFASRIPPKRQITLEELMGEMERIIKYDDENRIKIPKGSIVDTVDLELSEHDVDHDIEQLYEKIKSNTDSQGWSLFSSLTKDKPMREVVYSLLCLLYLAQSTPCPE